MLGRQQPIAHKKQKEQDEEACHACWEVDGPKSNERVHSNNAVEHENETEGNEYPRSDKDIPPRRGCHMLCGHLKGRVLAIMMNERDLETGRTKFLNDFPLQTKV